MYNAAMLEPGRRNLHQQLVEDLTQNIVGGVWPPGTLLPPEAQLASDFNVSRIVVRETVKVLVEKGLLSVRQGRGTTVRSEQDWNPIDPLILRLRQQGDKANSILVELVEIRQLFEVHAAGRAALRISDRELEQLGMHLRRMDSLLDAPIEFNKSDAEFHLMIVQAAQNRVLTKLIEPVRDLLRTSMYETVMLPNAPQGAQVFHWRIFRAIEAHDRAAAEQAMRQHLDKAAIDLMTAERQQHAQTTS